MLSIRFASRLVSSVLALSMCLLPRAAAAQEFRTLDPGTTISIRLNRAIDVTRHDDRVYTGIVDRDVRADNGRIAVPRGSAAELYVRVTRDNDLILDLESIVANGQRYAIAAEPNRVESDNSLVGSIIGGISGGAVRGQAVRIPRDSVLSFRLERRLDVGVPDRGYDRDGWHYHGRDNRDDRR
jgi:hypothetical protein